jgi:hypothetical protein
LHNADSRLTKLCGRLQRRRLWLTLHDEAHFRAVQVEATPEPVCRSLSETSFQSDADSIAETVEISDDEHVLTQGRQNLASSSSLHRRTAKRAPDHEPVLRNTRRNTMGGMGAKACKEKENNVPCSVNQKSYTAALRHSSDKGFFDDCIGAHVTPKCSLINLSKQTRRNPNNSNKRAARTDRSGLRFR